MDKTEFRDTINAIKSSHSLVDYANSHGLRVRHNGAAINAPHQFRPDDNHPSFAIYHNGAFDFATGKHYDLFEFIQTYENCSFIEAVQKFEPTFFTPKNSQVPPELVDLAKRNRDTLNTNISKWHEALLANPECTDQFTGTVIHPLDYLHSRGINDDSIEKFLLGFDPRSKRIIIPFLRNGKPAFYAGRDLTSRFKQLDSEGKPLGQKYKYATTDYGIEKIIWGLDYLRNPNPAHSRKSLMSDIENTLTEQYLKDDTLFICEGLLDAIILVQNGWQVLCTGGGAIGHWNLPYALDLMRSYKQVILAFDNDKSGKDFTRKWADYCLGEHIKFLCADIPTDYQGHPVKDINDYALAGGDISMLAKWAQSGLAYYASTLNTVEEIYQFVKKVHGFASDHDMDQIKEALEARRGIEEKSDPNAPDITYPLFKKGQIASAFKSATEKSTELEVAERVLAKHNLIYASDNRFYEYTGQKWEQQTDLTVIRYALDVLGPNGTQGRAAAITKRLKAMLETKTPFNSQHVFPVQNGVFLLDERKIVPHNPDFMNTSVVDYAVNPEGVPKAMELPDYEAERISVETTSGTIMQNRLNALNERREREAEENLPLHKAFNEAGYISQNQGLTDWQKFCRTTFVDEHGNYDCLLEREVQLMSGYGFYPDNRLQANFLLLGKGGNAKSTYLEVMKAIFGRDKCSFLRPDRLSNPFDAMVLCHSWINICHESAKSMNGAEETLKAVTSGDPITASYKGQDAVSFQSRAKWLIAANSIMDIKDVSYGFLRRMIIIPFNAKFKDKKADLDMVEKLLKHKNEIFWWVYEGYQMLRQGARFGQLPQQKKLAVKLRETIDPCYLFVREGLIERECPFFSQSERNTPITESEMFDWYVEWSKKTYTDILPRYTVIDRIIDALEDRMPTLKHVRLVRQDDGVPQNFFINTAIPLYEEELARFDDESRALLASIGALGPVEINTATDTHTPAPAISDEGMPPFCEECVSDPEAPEAPESEDKASGGDGGDTAMRLYPHFGKLVNEQNAFDFSLTLQKFMLANPETWQDEFTTEEFMTLAKYTKRQLAKACGELSRDCAQAVLDELRSGWVARKKITQSKADDEPAGDTLPAGGATGEASQGRDQITQSNEQDPPTNAGDGGEASDRE